MVERWAPRSAPLSRTGSFASRASRVSIRVPRLMRRLRAPHRKTNHGGRRRRHTNRMISGRRGERRGQAEDGANYRPGIGVAPRREPAPPGFRLRTPGGAQGEAAYRAERADRCDRAPRHIGQGDVQTRGDGDALCRGLGGAGGRRLSGAAEHRRPACRRAARSMPAKRSPRSPICRRGRSADRPRTGAAAGRASQRTALQLTPPLVVLITAAAVPAALRPAA